jgi:hypothetical protein
MSAVESAAEQPAVPAPARVAKKPYGADWPRWRVGLWNVSWACAAAAPVSIARWLTPDAKGVGTHQQLGLPPCTFYWLSGIPCPFCGMTTSWSYAAHLMPLRSFHNQPMGLVLFVITAAFIPGLLVMAAMGRSAFTPEQVFDRMGLRGWSALFLGLLFAWIWKIALVRGFVS